MKKPYQIEAQRAVKQLDAVAADGNPAVQMMLPMAEMVGWLRKGVGQLIRQAGLQLMDLLMQEEVREVVGERSQRQPERTATRWGSERGYCVVMGQKVPVRRPRVRTADDKEVRLGSYRKATERGLARSSQSMRIPRTFASIALIRDFAASASAARFERLEWENPKSPTTIGSIRASPAPHLIGVHRLAYAVKMQSFDAACR